MNTAWKAAPIIWALFFWQEAAGQGAGAQVNFLAPIGMKSFGVTYMDVESNFRFGQTLIGDADIETRSATAGFSWNFALAERFAQFSVQASYVTIIGRGRLDPSNPQGLPPEISARQYGWGDPAVSLRVGLIGAPALGPKEWLEHDKGFQMYAKLGAYVPLGNYDDFRILNTGFNRWAWDLSLPMVLPLDRAPRRTFLEITPLVRVFGDNSDPFGDARRLTQDELYIIEFQASHQFTPKVWTSLGVQYQKGGRTSADGLEYNNELDQWFGELWLGYRAARNVILAGGYGRIFGQADNDAQGFVWRARAVIAF